MITPERVGDILLFIAAVPANAAVVTFSKVTWTRSHWGRHMMGYMAAVALVLDLGVLHLFVGDSEAFRWIRVTSYAVLVGMLFWRLVILWDAYREGSHDDAVSIRPAAGSPPDVRP